MIGALMCYLQRNIKRLLASRPLSYVGLMTIGIGLLVPAGLAGSAVYALGHGMVKGSLFLAAGILLHRFESVDERDLHAKGYGHWRTAAIFFASGLGLAGLPGSGLSTGHSISTAASAKTMGFGSVRWIFLFAGVVTAAAVLRAGGHIFFGWGPIESSGGAPKQEEKPETKAGHQKTPVTMLVPALTLAILGLLIGLTPRIRSAAVQAAGRFQDTNAYAADVLENRSAPALHFPVPAKSAGFDGILAAALAIMIALLESFSHRARRVANSLAKPFCLVHRLHSGHVGDYIAFLAFGLACFGLICVYWLR